MNTASPMNILLVNRHMNIGGVETYLYRLCAGLVARGHRVGLLTEGGLYEGKASDAGARLHKVASLEHDWHRQVPELCREGYSLVHAHNYHSARVGRRLAAELEVPYLMSVHGPRPRLKQLLFRDWSKEVIVMSEGDRDNISWFGGVPFRRTILSFYGIDTDRFHTGIDTQSLRQELEIPAGAPTLVFISRFSNRKADVGHALLDSLPAIRNRFGDLQVFLVGEGPESQALARHIHQINAGFGHPVARLMGPRRDVERFMALSSVAVCTANTALEAMACGTPTLAAGRTGYFGLVTRANFDAARRLCFADHGRSPNPMTAGCFIKDIPPLLADPAPARRNAAGNAALIAKDFSVARMSEQMEEIYRRSLA
ncbi:MAG: glycosyltransferase family 4 protein [Opitutaceae bacterium]|jgi:glycosyltransferase involved in cell wall biosynthesis